MMRMIAGLKAGMTTTGREAVVGEEFISAFEEFFLENYRRVVSIVFKLVGDKATAEEVAADAFWKLHQRGVMGTADSNAGGWLYRTAVRMGLDAVKRASRRRRHEAEASWELVRTAPIQDPLTDVLTAERQARIRCALAALKPIYAELLLLRSNGLSYKELAQALHLKPSSVGTMLARAEAEFLKKVHDVVEAKE